MAIYVGTYEGNLEVDGLSIFGSPIHIFCKPQIIENVTKSVNFPVNTSLLELADNFCPNESSHEVPVKKKYRDVLMDIYHRQRVDSPLIALFSKSDLSPGCFLCSDFTAEKVYVARSSDKYVLDHIERFGRDFTAEL